MVGKGSCASAKVVLLTKNASVQHDKINASVRSNPHPYRRHVCRWCLDVLLPHPLLHRPHRPPSFRLLKEGVKQGSGGETGELTSSGLSLGFGLSSFGHPRGPSGIINNVSMLQAFAFFL